MRVGKSSTRLWNRKKRLQSFLLACLMPVPIILSAVAAAPANASTCEPGHSNFFDGYAHSTSRSENFEGASADIVNHTNTACSGDPSRTANFAGLGTNFTTAWVMIADYNLTSWSQVGVIKDYTSLQWVWAEYRRNNGVDSFLQVDNFGRLLNEGEAHGYFELWNVACGCIQSKFDSTVIAATAFNPFAGIPGGGWNKGPTFPPRFSPQYSGEKTYQASNILGTTSAHVAFRSLGVQRYIDDSLVLEPCTLSAVLTATRSTYHAYSCSSFDIWTTS